MKRRSVVSLLLVVFLLSPFAFAQETEGTLQDGMISPWRVQAGFQLFSLADEARPMVGPAISYSLRSSSELGLRTLLPVNGGGTYAINLFWREFFGDDFIQTFVEPQFCFNLLTQGVQQAASAAMNFGMSFRLNSELSLAASVGLEFYSANLPLAARMEIGPLRMAPKLLLTSSFFF